MHVNNRGLKKSGWYHEQRRYMTTRNQTDDTILHFVNSYNTQRYIGRNKIYDFQEVFKCFQNYFITISTFLRYKHNSNVQEIRLNYKTVLLKSDISQCASLFLTGFPRWSLPYQGFLNKSDKILFQNHSIVHFTFQTKSWPCGYESLSTLDDTIIGHLWCWGEQNKWLGEVMVEQYQKNYSALSDWLSEWL